MTELIKIKNINQEYQSEKILTNINISFNYLQNIVIFSESNDLRSCHFLLDIIAKLVQPQIGTVEYYDDKTSEFFIGYKMFDSILEKDVMTVNVVDALINSQDKANKKEISELTKLLRIDELLSKSVFSLSDSEKNWLNILLLLIIKPKVLILKGLSLPGSSIMQNAALEYIKQYLTKYKITLIIATNDKNTIDSLCDRGINLVDTVIESDFLTIKKNIIHSNDIDSKPKKMNFEEDLLDSVYKLEKAKKEINLDQSRKDEEILVSKMLTKSLSLKNNYSPTEALQSDLERIIIEKQNQDDYETNIVSNSSINNTVVYRTKVLINENQDNSNVVEIYHQRKQLQDQMESSSFATLSIELQGKVYDNYHHANNLIIKLDPTHKYDPYTNNFGMSDSLIDEKNHQSVSLQKNSITKMIFDENLDIDTLDVNDPGEEIVRKTKTLALLESDPNFNNVKTKTYSTNELTKKISTASDIEYMSKNIETKKRWKLFSKQKVENNRNVNYVQDNNMTNDFLASSKRTTPSRVVKTEKFEPTKKLLNIENINLMEETKDILSPPPIPQNKKIEAIELKIKKRTQLNKLEELYYDALEERKNK